MRITSKPWKIFIYLCLILLAVISIFPFYWLAVTSTLTSADVMRFPPVLTPGSMFAENVKSLVTTIRFGTSMLNTVFVAGTVTVSVAFFSSLAGFLFAKFKFPGKKILFGIVLLTMMIPTQMSMVPLFIIMNKLQWASTFKALIVPGMVNAFGIFWIRQYAEGAIHDDLLNAARIDGCGTFRLYTRIAFPMLLPAVSFLALFTFMNTWNDYLWPLIIISKPEKYTIQVALSQLNGAYYGINYGMIMAGTLLATLPLIIVFLIFSRHFMENISAGAIKD